MKQDIAIFGLGAFGQNMTRELTAAGHQIIAVDCNQERVESVKELVAEAIIGDLSSEQIIKELDPGKFDIIIVDLGRNLEALILCITHLQNEQAKRIIAKVTLPTHQEILERLGIEEIIVPYAETAKRLADQITTPNIIEIFEIDNGCIAKVTIPKRLSGKTLKELQLRDSYNLSPILIRKKGMKKDHLLFKHDFQLEEGDELTLLGEDEVIHQVFKTD